MTGTLARTAGARGRLTTRTGDRLAVAATAMAMALVALSGWLLGPELPDPPYSVELAAERPGTQLYPGAIALRDHYPVENPPGPDRPGREAPGGVAAGRVTP
jgi:hypothetical protein